MFFVFHILVLLNYVPDSNNFVLKGISQGVAGRIKQNDNRLNVQDKDVSSKIISLSETGENLTNIRSPNLKVNLFDKKLSDEMLSIKQNIYGRDVFHTLKKLKKVKNNVGTSTLELKQMWPAVELLFKLKEIEENEDKDDFKFKHLLPDENVNQSPSSEYPLKVENHSKIEEHHNESENKVVDLRSLSIHAPSDINEKHQSMKVSHCGCSRSSINPNWTPNYGEYTYPTQATTFHKCVGCTRTSLSYSLMPFYVPYEPYFHYQSNMFKEDAKRPEDKDLYYEYEKERHVETYSDDEDEIKESKKKKKKKCRGDKGGILINVDYDLKPRETKVKWNTEFLEGRPNKLVKDLMDDLSMLYPDSIIKKCYCSSSVNYPVIISHIVLVLFIFSNVVVKVLSV